MIEIIAYRSDPSRAQCIVRIVVNGLWFDASYPTFEIACKLAQQTALVLGVPQHREVL